MEDQKTITDWADTTFGPTHPEQVAKRMLKEVSELMELLEGVKDLPVNRMPAQTLLNLREETADVFIMLSQIAEKLGMDLTKHASGKMLVNRGRRWARSPEGHMQHVRCFVEPGSGILMHLNRWYVLSDSGSFYEAEGFGSKQSALAWAKSREVCDRFGIEPDWVGAPTFISGEDAWDDGGDGGFGVNVLYGRDLYDFWLAQLTQENTMLNELSFIPSEKNT